MSGMQKKTIRKALKGKIGSWIRSVDDENLRNLLDKNVIVTGGCITSMLLGEEVNDYDVYFRDYKTTKAVAEYYVDKFKARKKTQGGVPVTIEVSATEPAIDGFGGSVKVKVKSAGIASSEQKDDYQYFESVSDDDTVENYVQNVVKSVLQTMERKSVKDYEPVFLSSNAITLTSDIQLVLRFFGEPDEIHGNYDFAHCMNYYDYGADEVYLRQEALESILSKTLIYKGSLYPIASIIRTRKFIKRGWKISAGQYLKMIFQCGDLNLHDVNVLQDQLTGVDAAYFAEVMQKITSDGVDIDTAYIVKIIDEMF